MPEKDDTAKIPPVLKQPMLTEKEKADLRRSSKEALAYFRAEIEMGKKAPTT